MLAKIVHLVSQDLGGAGKACVRLHLALLKAGLNSSVLLSTKATNAPGLLNLKQSKLQKSINKTLRNLSLLPLRKSLKAAKDYFSPNIRTYAQNEAALLANIESIDPDLVHLHWIEGGFVNVATLENLQVPLLWSLHDENPYTGGCHYVPSDCNGYKEGCLACPLLFDSKKQKPPSYKNAARLTFSNKQASYEGLDLTINGLSSWIAARARESSLLGKHPVINLPNPIDTSLYKPISRGLAKEILGVAGPRITIGFGAVGGSATRRKGFLELKEALSNLKQYSYHLLVYGGSSEAIEGLEMTNLGELKDELSLVLFYNACDIFIQPSLAENLSNAIMESLSCGTPVVSFDIGGNADMIDPGYNGYLAKPMDTKDLARGIEWLASLSLSHANQIREQARQSVLDKFSYEVVAPLYAAAYKNILEKSKT